MAYIGRGTENISNVEVLDNLTFDGSASYTLQKSSTNFVPSSANNLLISISGVVQQGNFTVSGSTITFDTTVASSDTCDWILHYGTGLITTVADGAITEAKLGSNAVTTAKINNGAITSAKLDSGLALGKIGQVVNFTTSTQLSSGSSSYVDTNLVASITPSSASSKIYIQAFSLCGAERANAEASFQWKLLRDSTDIWVSGSQGYHIYVQGTSNIQPHFGETLLYIDSPSSTSSLTYKIQAKTNSGSTIKFQYQSTVGSLILMEVLA